MHLWSVFNRKSVLVVLIELVYRKTTNALIFLDNTQFFWCISAVMSVLLSEPALSTFYFTRWGSTGLVFFHGGSAGHSQPADNLKSHFNPSFWWLISTSRSDPTFPAHIEKAGHPWERWNWGSGRELWKRNSSTWQTEPFQSRDGEVNPIVHKVVFFRDVIIYLDYWGTVRKWLEAERAGYCHFSLVWRWRFLTFFGRAAFYFIMLWEDSRNINNPLQNIETQSSSQIIFVRPLIKATQLNRCCVPAAAAASDTKTLWSFSWCNLHHFTCLLRYMKSKVELRGLLV